MIFQGTLYAWMSSEIEKEKKNGEVKLEKRSQRIHTQTLVEKLRLAKIAWEW